MICAAILPSFYDLHIYKDNLVFRDISVLTDTWNRSISAYLQNDFVQLAKQKPYCLFGLSDSVPSSSSWFETSAIFATNSFKKSNFFSFSMQCLL